MDNLYAAHENLLCLLCDAIQKEGFRKTGKESNNKKTSKETQDNRKKSAAPARKEKDTAGRKGTRSTGHPKKDIPKKTPQIQPKPE